MAAREQHHLGDDERETFRKYFEASRGRHRDPDPGRQTRTHRKPRPSSYRLRRAVHILQLHPDIRGNLSADRLPGDPGRDRLQSIIECPLPALEIRPGTGAEPDSPPAAGRHERIIDAATATLFHEHGFYDVRIDDIAKASEMSTATLLPACGQQ